MSKPGSISRNSLPSNMSSNAYDSSSTRRVAPSFEGFPGNLGDRARLAKNLQREIMSSPKLLPGDVELALKARQVEQEAIQKLSDQEAQRVLFYSRNAMPVSMSRPASFTNLF